MKSSLITYLNTTSDLTDLVGTEIRFGRAEQTDTLPYLIINKIDGDHKHHMTAATGVVIGRFQFDCYGATPLLATALAEVLRQELDGYRGDMDDVFVSMCHLTDERDVEIQPVDGAHIGISTVQQDYMIGWTVSVPTF